MFTNEDLKNMLQIKTDAGGNKIVMWIIIFMFILVIAGGLFKLNTYVIQRLTDAIIKKKGSVKKSDSDFVIIVTRLIMVTAIAILTVLGFLLFNYLNFNITGME